jgi:hypothetical protein
VSGGGIWDEAREDSSFTHLRLLYAFPTVGVGQHEVDLILHRCPEVDAVHVCVLDIAGCTFEEVGQEVGEDVDDCLIGWQSRNIFADFFSGARADSRSEVKFEPESMR